MVSYVRLATQHVPPHKTIPDGINTVLVFEPTIAGYSAAAKWIRQNQQTLALGVCRIIIPYARLNKDPPALYTEVGEAYPAYSTSESADCETLTPDHVGVFQASADNIKDALMLRSVKTGLSFICEYMLKLARIGLDKSEMIGAVVMKYKVPTSDARNEYNKLLYGNLPRMSNVTMEHLPHALVNGPFPVSQSTAVEAIRRKINTSGFVMADVVPECVGHTFSYQNCEWLSPYIESSNGAVCWPYSITPEDHPSAIYSNAHKMFVCAEPFFVKVEWDPCFLEGDYTMDEALDAWIKHRLSVLVVVRSNMAKVRALHDLKRKLIRSVCVQENVSGGNNVVFIGETKRAKRNRIAAQYGGHVELLDTPISEFGMDSVFDAAVEVPECARDLLLGQLIG